VSPRKAKASGTAADAGARQNAAPDNTVERTGGTAPEVASEVAASQAAAPGSESSAAAAAAAPGARGARTLTGRVVSNRMQKTIAVEVERLVKHPAYGKYVRRTTKLLAHDESGASREGDLVTITPCRPLSRRKSWRLLEVVQKAAGR
jgi:small subunit ribosomal protein S17